ncbi:MAG: exo-alpha-sialidase [Clostridia bacterium]|nr:exo-alpha-sialidase [Clostridia bacterium]
MKINITENAKVIMSNRDSRHNYFAWPTVARLKNGKIAVVASGFRLYHICPFGKAVMTVSEDEGNTFSPLQTIIDTPLDDRDAGLCPFGESGVIVTSFNNSREMQRNWSRTTYMDRKTEAEIKYIESYIDNVTDEQEEKYLGSTYRVSYDNGITFGEVFRSPVSCPHGPIVLNDGTFLYVGTDSTGVKTREYNGITVAKITLDGKGEIIGRIDAIPEGVSWEPHAVQLPDGKIICHIRVEKWENGKQLVFTTFQSESTDGGKTWTKPHQLVSKLGGAPAHLMLHSSGALISVYGYREAPYAVKAMISFDGGETWDIDHIIYEQPHSADIGYPASVELSDGSIMTVFYAKEHELSPAEIYSIKWNFEK